MAITYQSTSISAANAAAAGTAAQNAIRDALVAHPSGAWTLVEEFDSASLTVHWTVLKCDKTLSGVELDFFVCIGRVAATGQLTMMVGEVYTVATHTLSTFAPNPSGSPSSNSILADFSYGQGGGSVATFALGTAFPNSTGQPVAPVNTPAATMRFVTSVEKDYAIVNLNGTLFYVGALIDLIVPIPGLVAATPVGCFDLLNSSYGLFGALTRHPIDVALAPFQVAYAHAIKPVTINMMAAVERQALDTAVYLNPDRFQGNRVAASELAAIMAAADVGSGPASTASKTGALRGKFKNLRVATYPQAAVTYDTIVVDARKHIIMLDKGSFSSYSSEFVAPYNNSAQVKVGFVVDTGIAA